jgi:hypothetical protein
MLRVNYGVYTQELFKPLARQTCARADLLGDGQGAAGRYEEDLRITPSC